MAKHLGKVVDERIAQRSEGKTPAQAARIRQRTEARVEERRGIKRRQVASTFSPEAERRRGTRRRSDAEKERKRIETIGRKAAKGKKTPAKRIRARTEARRKARGQSIGKGKSDDLIKARIKARREGRLKEMGEKNRAKRAKKERRGPGGRTFADREAFSKLFPNRGRVLRKG